MSRKCLLLITRQQGIIPDSFSSPKKRIIGYLSKTCPYLVVPQDTEVQDDCPSSATFDFPNSSSICNAGFTDTKMGIIISSWQSCLSVSWQLWDCSPVCCDPVVMTFRLMDITVYLCLNNWLIQMQSRQQHCSDVSCFLVFFTQQWMRKKWYNPTTQGKSVSLTLTGHFSGQKFLMLGIGGVYLCMSAF